MGDQTYSVGPLLTQVYRSGGINAVLTLANLDTVNTIYLTEAEGTAPGNGFPLQAGNTISWDAGRALFVSCAPGQSAQLAVLENSGALFPTAGLASALINQGLPAALAAQIAIQGAPPLNAYDPLADNVDDGIILAANTKSHTYDVHKYNSVRFQFAYQTTGVTLSVPVIRPVRFDWYTNNNGAPGTIIDTERYYCYQRVSGRLETTGVMAPTRGYWLVTTLEAEIGPGAPSANGGHYIYSLIGAYQSIERPCQFLAYYGWGFSGMTIVGDTNTANEWQMSGAKGAAVITDFPPMQSGNNWLHVTVNAVTVAQLQVTLLDVDSGHPAAALWFPVSAAAGKDQTLFIAGNRPLQLTIQPANAQSTAVQVSVSSEPR